MLCLVQEQGKCVVVLHDFTTGDGNSCAARIITATEGKGEPHLLRSGMANVEQQDLMIPPPPSVGNCHVLASLMVPTLILPPPSPPALWRGLEASMSRCARGCVGLCAFSSDLGESAGVSAFLGWVGGLLSLVDHQRCPWAEAHCEA